MRVRKSLTVRSALGGRCVKEGGAEPPSSTRGRCDAGYVAGWMFWLMRNTLPGS
jgi:hypothetical protein